MFNRFMFMACVSGGEVTEVDAPLDTTVGEFKQLVLGALCADELRRKVSLVELALGDQPLTDDAASLGSSGVSTDAPVQAVLRKRAIRCLRKDKAFNR